MKCFVFRNGDSKMDGGGAKVQEPNTAGMLCIEFARYCCSFQHPVSDALKCHFSRADLLHAGKYGLKVQVSSETYMRILYRYLCYLD